MIAQKLSQPMALFPWEKFKCEKLSVVDAGFPRGWGANPLGGGPTYDFAKFSQKMHEIKRIWTLRRGARPSSP